MAAKRGTDYELLVRSLFQDILDEDTVKTILVEHDVVLHGASTDHQVDVYWKFEMGGIVYETVVQAKDWSRSVDQGELLKFAEVLDDLPGQPRGVFVTKTGYHKGARDVASGRGIVLYELYEQQPPPSLQIVVGGWVNVRIALASGGGEETRTFVAEYVIFTPRIVHLSYEVEPQWLEDVKLRLGSAAVDAIVTTPALLTDMFLYDADGRLTGSVQDISAEWSKQMRDSGELDGSKRRRFDRPTFLSLPAAPAERFQLRGISARVRIEQSEPITREMTRPDIAKYILKNVVDGNVRSFVRPRPPD